MVCIWKPGMWIILYGYLQQNVFSMSYSVIRFGHYMINRYGAHSNVPFFIYRPAHYSHLQRKVCPCLPLTHKWDITLANFLQSKGEQGADFSWCMFMPGIDLIFKTVPTGERDRRRKAEYGQSLQWSRLEVGRWVWVWGDKSAATLPRGKGRSGIRRELHIDSVVSEVRERVTKESI